MKKHTIESKFKKLLNEIECFGDCKQPITKEDENLIIEIIITLAGKLKKQNKPIYHYLVSHYFNVGDFHCD